MNLAVDRVVLLGEPGEMAVARLQRADLLALVGELLGEVVRGVAHRVHLSQGRRVVNAPAPAWVSSRWRPTHWRGRITCDPAPGHPGTADATAAAAEQVEAF